MSVETEPIVNSSDSVRFTKFWGLVRVRSDNKWVFGSFCFDDKGFKFVSISISNLQCSGSIGISLRGKYESLSNVFSVGGWRQWRLQKDVSTVDWAVRHHHATCLDARHGPLIVLYVWPASYECADTVSGPPCRQLASQDAASSSSFFWVPIRLQHDIAGNIDVERDDHGRALNEKVYTVLSPVHTVGEKCDCRRKRLSHFSPTVWTGL